MEFENPGVGKCVVLKEDRNSKYSLVYSITGNFYVIASHLDYTDGSWLYGDYVGNDLDLALYRFNNVTKENSRNERSLLDELF